MSEMAFHKTSEFTVHSSYTVACMCSLTMLNRSCEKDREHFTNISPVRVWTRVHILNPERKKILHIHIAINKEEFKEYLSGILE